MLDIADDLDVSVSFMYLLWEKKWSQILIIKYWKMFYSHEFVLLGPGAYSIPDMTTSLIRKAQ